MADLLLGIDLGTTSVKAAVLDANGTCVQRFAQTYATRRPLLGHAEQDPDDWMALITAALDGFAAAGLSGKVGFGCLCSQVNTHVFVDAAGHPLLPAILWQDTRAAAEAAELDAQLTIAQKIAYLGGPTPIDASHPLARMLWVARHHPDLWQRTAHVLLPKDYCLLHLTGTLACDPMSAVGLVGPDLTYVAPILDLVPGATKRLAPLAGLTEVIGRLRPEFGLSGTQMITGTMDGWAGLFGGGATGQGRMVYLGGTSEILGIASHQSTGEPGIIVFPPTGDLRLHAGPTQSGGASQNWFCDLAGLPVDALSADLTATPRRSPTPLFLPQLAGERAPLWNPDLRGAFLGLDAGMTKTDLARGVLEGVALSARHVLGALQASADVQGDSLTCGGGGFRSHAWGQIRADVLNKRLSRLSVNDPVVIGAVALASFAAGGFSSLTAAHAGLARYDTEWLPNPANRALYDDLFAIYLEAIAANEGLGRKLARL